MIREKVELQRVVDGLRSEGLLPENSDDTVTAFLESLHETQPWYIRTMVGFGAWLASLLLIGFVGSIGFAADAGFVIVGALFLGGAIFARMKSGSDFLVQCALASSLAGQAVLAYGIVQVSGGNDFETVLGIVIVLNGILFFVFPDRIHRVLSILIAMMSLGFLLYSWKFNAVIPILGPLAAAAMVFFYKKQGAIFASGKGHLIRPLITGLMLTAFGFLLLSIVYILPELRLEFSFYPRPWISSILLGALLLYVGTQVWPQIGDVAGSREMAVFYGLLVAITAAAWAIPGLLLALIVIMSGASSGNRAFIGAGIAFLVVFIATYFYGIQVSMLTKSITLVSTGAAVLTARWLLLKVTAGPVEGGANHA
ncbi:MAG: DUF4401 domain-containing protein [Gammaproteobacteria bacterium]|nr:DUF4401 domain-containing protein [Gammaproteobacteria bacterium]